MMLVESEYKLMKEEYSLYSMEQDQLNVGDDVDTI